MNVIDEVARASIRGEGPTIYLKHPHTAKHFRGSLYLPPRFIERSPLDLAHPKEHLLDRLGREVDEILDREEELTLPASVIQHLRTGFPCSR